MDIKMDIKIKAFEYNNIRNFNEKTYSKLFNMILLWTDSKFSDEAKKKIKLYFSCVYNKKYLDYNYIGDYLYINIVNDVLNEYNLYFVLNNNETKLICCYKCYLCCCRMDEENMQYTYKGKIKKNNFTFVNDYICSNCIVDSLKKNPQLKKKYIQRKKMLYQILQKKYNYQIIKYISNIIYDQFILGLNSKLTINQIICEESNYSKLLMLNFLDHNDTDYEEL